MFFVNIYCVICTRICVEIKIFYKKSIAKAKLKKKEAGNGSFLI